MTTRAARPGPYPGPGPARSAACLSSRLGREGAGREGFGRPAPAMPHSARTLLALQRAAGNRAVASVVAPAAARAVAAAGAVTVQRDPTKIDNPTDRSVNWYADDRNPAVRFVEMRSNDRSNTRRYFRIDDVVYWHDSVNDQYVNAKNNDLLWDPSTGRVITRLRNYPIDFYQCQQRGVLRYDNRLYQPMDLIEGFKPGDLLYGKETERKLIRSTVRGRAKDMNVTADEYNREVVPHHKAVGPEEMSDDAFDYHEYLRSQGPSSRAVVESGSGLQHETRLKRSCVAMVDYKTRQGYRIHFELQGVDLANEPQYYTETELRFILENRRFLNMAHIKFYRDGVLVPTERVIADHEMLVDEILAKGRVVPGQPHARIVSDLGLESYDNPPDRSLVPVPVPVPVAPQPLATGAFLQVPAGETITGTRQQLWQRFQPADLLPPVLFSGDAVTWGSVNWRCDRAVLNEQGEDVITLRRLS